MQSLLLSGGSVGSTSCLGCVFPKPAASQHRCLGRRVPGPRALCSLLQRRCLSRVPLRFSEGDTLPPQTMRQILQTLGRLRKGQRAFYRDHTKYFYTPTHEGFAFVTAYHCKSMVTVILHRYYFAIIAAIFSVILLELLQPTSLLARLQPETVQPIGGSSDFRVRSILLLWMENYSQEILSYSHTAVFVFPCYSLPQEAHQSPF